MNLVDPLLAVLVVANLLPILPIVLGVVSAVPRRRRKRVALRALAVGNVVAFLFAVGGGLVLDAMRSEIDDLRIAGGIILLVFAIYDLLFSREDRKEALGDLMEESEHDGADVGPIPLGVPIMIGPATLTTVLVLSETYGLVPVTLALLVNAVLNVGLIVTGQALMDAAGRGFIRAAGKVFGLLLATLAVTMVRTGVMGVWTSG